MSTDHAQDAVQALTVAVAQLGDRVDAAEVICRVVTAVAANVGGVDVLLAGRPGSWEADHVRRIVTSTTGDDLSLLAQHRTEPVLVPVDVEELLYEVAGDAIESAHAELDEAGHGVSEAELDALEEEREVIEHIWDDDIATCTTALTEALCAAAVEVGVPEEVPVALVGVGTEVVDALPTMLLERAWATVPLPGGGRSYRARAADRR